MDSIRFTPAELQQLAQSGDLKPDDIKRMDPADKKAALEAYITATADKEGSKITTNGVMPPVPASIARVVGAGIDGLTGGGGPGVVATGKSLWDKVAPHAGGVIGGELAQQTGLPWWIGSIIGGHLGSKTTGSSSPSVPPPSGLPGEIPYKPGDPKIGTRTLPMTDEAYKGATGHDRGSFPTPPPSGEMDLPLRPPASPIDALGKLLDSKPGGNGNGGPPNLEKWGNLTSPGPANTNNSPMTGEVRRLSAPTRTPWEDSRNTPFNPPKPGEKSVESIQEEIAKLLDAVQTKRRSPQ